jgi:dihydrolipoamide dehydrogenase
MKKDGSGLKITLRNTDGAESTVETDKVLVAVGRAPNTEDIGLEKVGIETEKGFIPVRDYYETSVSGIYAVGDVTSSPLLAHVASGEGEIAVEHMAGKNPSVKLDPLSIPSAVYSEPQLAGFGYTEAGVKEKGIAYRAVSFPYRGSGKAVAIGKPDGLVKVIIDSDTDEILGAHIVGEDATELIHELLLARSAELLPEDIADMIHAHPTLSETVMEGMRAVLDRAIHA